MKNQYVGDIGDYGKYALLRTFIDAGIKVGVNWYLTEDDSSMDGKFTEYLKNGNLRHYQPEIFDCLSDIAFDTAKTVQDVENSGILCGASFYSALLKPVGKPAERVEIRKEWFRDSVSALANADLIFMDPDNGLLETGDASKPGAEKYILPEEVEEYFRSGKNVVYYCHKGRRSLGAWDSYVNLMFDRIPEAQPAVLTYHKGSQRSYIFLIHKESFKQYRGLIDKYRSRWERLVSEEYTNRGDAAGHKEGELVFDRPDGSTVTLTKRADGQLAIVSSRTPSTTQVISADWLCSHLGIW